MHEYELYGASIFETLLADKGRFWRLQNHWKRLQGTARALGFQAPSFETFKTNLSHAHDSNHTQVMRYTLIRQGGIWSGQPTCDETKVLARPFTKTTAPIHLYLPAERFANADGWRQFKTGSRMAYQHLLMQASYHHCQDSLLIDQEERILETCFGNLIWCESGQWYTPRLDLGLLPGIYREWLVETGLVEESTLFLGELSQITGMIVCNSVHGAREVAMVGGCKVTQTATATFLQSLPKRPYLPMEI